MNDAVFLAGFLLGKGCELPESIKSAVDRVIGGGDSAISHAKISIPMEKSSPIPISIATPTYSSKKIIRAGNSVGTYIPITAKDDIISLCAAGKTDREICKIYNCDQSTVSRFRKRHAIDKEPMSAISSDHIDRVKSLISMGKSDKAISEIYRCSVCSVERFRKRHGIPRRSQFHLGESNAPRNGALN